ncbi:alpha/beta fold hydrolase [Frankia sp. CNm7]|uniref:Alpha/beta fold hydrolase n=1 Tax=Frankia nepalensis TaxID=1836974 RepID=A0A937UQA4_9ACTN|nr:alpha/beta fold hydrolase [Frankia nepalensis]MBL7501130.1 alpha/beta fold hydrolase [Frankia nepalensis]MBL7515781.1 alpha/beta fold hydrolase [Frankia nepalensis]MBL7522077.1 alpha/beta fold hydrolase [Frankia nepalensis]MBL7631664.1 alpha/beta fold hydrolase [Frankia nepalensis]
MASADQGRGGALASPGIAARPGTLLPGAEPFELGASGDVGVLLVHGFTGTPQSMRPWGESLAAAGLDVRCPLLPGHGTRWRDLAGTGWRDWYGAVDEAFGQLRARHSQVFVMGLSMGGTLTLRLAEERGAEVAGVVTVNPSLGTDRWDARLAPLIARVRPSVPGIASDIKAAGAREVGYDRVPVRAFISLQELWRITVPDLSRIVCPVLTFRSVVDHVVEPSSGRRLLAGVTSAPVTERLLPDSYHVATLDNDRETIFQGSVEFVRVHAGTPAQRPAAVDGDA